MGEKTTSWNLLNEMMVAAKVQEALTNAKIFVNNNKFTILRQLGSGGASTVYEVFSQEKEKRYALKIVDLLGQEGVVKHDLIKEIIFLEKLKNSDLVVKAYDYELRNTATEHRLLVLMELGQKDLQTIFDENNGLSPAGLR